MCAMTELEVVTPNLRGSCVTIHNQTHGLFKVMRPQASAADAAPLRWHVEPHDRPSDPDVDPGSGQS
jgi:hypothetical protein